jgi:multisubunit Na+/H+ antiporter MnhF subunit
MIKIFSIKGAFNYMIIASILSFIVTFALDKYLHVEK